tara:strand:- start:645 stop:1499 length:855 start_codon:yes stop_codon:yes gene_type:complete
MSSKSHNKKRNVGLIYEFLVRYISRSLVEGHDSNAKKAVLILNRHFQPGTELYREFRLFNSLYTTSVSSENVVASILSEARLAAKRYNVGQLDKEKSKLIREINYQINDPAIFNQNIADYQVLATIQTLLNDWRNPAEVNIARVAKYEDKLTQWLLTEKTMDTDLNSHKSPESNQLMVDIMTKKLNEKYSHVLSERQQEVLQHYTVSVQLNDNSAIAVFLENVRKSSLAQIDKYIIQNPEQRSLCEKLTQARCQLVEEDLDQMDDQLIERYLKYIKLLEEMEVP